MAIINMHDAKTRLSDLVARAQAGEVIVIARRNRPAVRLVPVDAASRAGGALPPGFGEGEQADYDAGALEQALAAGREFTIMRDGKAVAKVVPIVETKQRVPGRFAHLRGSLPSDLFDQPLGEDELAAWEGRYSADGDVGDGGR